MARGECSGGIRGLVDVLSLGIRVEAGSLSLNLEARDIKWLPGGRVSLIIVASREGGVTSEICRVLAFCGRGPYRPWVELYSFEERLSLGPTIIELKGSSLESALLDAAASSLGPGEPLFIEYVWDGETLEDLTRGVHPAFTRLGWLLLERGFTWFKLWYYPEGFMEGGEKIQAEKPISDSRRRAHLEELASEAEKVLRNPFASEASKARARAFLESIRNAQFQGNS